ncbi:MAG: 4-hydroxy-3-methylbut-2-enyl diphosphate reductase [bacterium]
MGNSGIEITIARNAGFCFGVQRAVDIAFRLGDQHPGEVFTLGPIIHNSNVVEQLEKRSVHVVDSLDNVKSGIFIVRSHGLPPDIINIVKNKGLQIIDATCPFVKKVQTYALSLKKEGYPVLLIGDREHPEVLAIRGYVENDIMICQTPEDLKHLSFPQKLGIVAQTTQDYENFKKIILYLLDIIKDLKIYNTICDSTIIRQKSTLKLAKDVDLMIVIGGKNSANTNRLANLSLSVNQRTYFIEKPNEINCEWFHGIKSIGISAGASTPKWIIDQVYKKIENLTKEVCCYNI